MMIFTRNDLSSNITLTNLNAGTGRSDNVHPNDDDFACTIIVFSGCDE